MWTENSRLKALSATKHVHGVPLNVPFTDLKDLALSVKATHVHENEDENARFALAVRVFAYPNEVFSVWVYVISIVRRA